MMGFPGSQSEDQAQQFGGADVDLAQLAGLDTDGIKSLRRTKFPKGVYKWRILPETGFDIQEVTNRKTNQKYKRAVIKMPLECLEVGEVQFDAGTEEKDQQAILESLVGKTHYEQFPIEPDKKEEGIGYYKAFLEDVGVQASGELGHLIDTSKSHEFYGIMDLRKNDTDPENPWRSLSRDKHKLKSAMAA